MAAESVFIYPGGREVPKGAAGPRPRQQQPPASPASRSASMPAYSSIPENGTVLQSALGMGTTGAWRPI